MSGSNDQHDAVSVISSLEKILKIGIVSASKSSSVKFLKPVTNIFGAFDTDLDELSDNEESEYSNFLALDAKQLEFSKGKTM